MVGTYQDMELNDKIDQLLYIYLNEPKSFQWFDEVINYLLIYSEQARLFRKIFSQ